MGEVRLEGHVDVPPERLPPVRAALAEHVRLTRAEPGCLAFSVREDPRRPGRFTVSERFASRAAFDVHQARAAASPWGKISDRVPRLIAASAFAAQEGRRSGPACARSAMARPTTTNPGI
ncbi:MAG: antibiotic biosynthesis monooxygenase [Alphaproteobacteria bacterium]|nr:MAG: antibiotic biosynthesis monooxygenase [Alphaproteobacteria bacterium]